MTEQRIVGGAELPQGATKPVDVGGIPICLVHAEDGRFYAISDVCSHEGAALSDGWVADTEIECPRHNSMFDLRTGRPTSLPATEPIRTYSLVLDGPDVIITTGG